MLIPTITVPQDRETIASRDIVPGPIAFTYVYARSRDSQIANTSGQDFIAYRYTAERIAFAVCDGVSQSFYGEIAARFLGLRLVDFLWNTDAANIPPFLVALNQSLNDWTADASAVVQAKTFRPNLPEMQKVALERKRENGSETMFVAGCIDRRASRIALCWMGDMRLWLWDHAMQSVDIPGAVWETRERWSSRLGPKNGSAHGCIMPLTGITHITAHSDGVGDYGPQFSEISQDLLNSMVDDLKAGAASDDISVFDVDLAVRPLYGDFITLAAPALRVPPNAEPVLTWKPVPLASRYRVLIDDGLSPYTHDVQTTTYFPPHALTTTLTCAVQALNDYAYPSAWSNFVMIDAGELTAAPAALAMPAISAPLPEERLAAKTQPKKRAKQRQKKSRLSHLLTLLVSILLLTVITIAAWIALVVVGWNDLIRLMSGK